jgi:hypothetical protein
MGAAQRWLAMASRVAGAMEGGVEQWHERARGRLQNGAFLHRGADRADGKGGVWGCT